MGGQRKRKRGGSKESLCLQTASHNVVTVKIKKFIELSFKIKYIQNNLNYVFKRIVKQTAMFIYRNTTTEAFNASTI